MITVVDKTKIQRKVEDHCERLGSINKASNSLKSVSPATISNIINGRWDLISDGKWLNIGKQVGYSSKEKVYVETDNLKFLFALMLNALQHRNVFAVIDEAGSGKSVSTRLFTEKNKHVYRIECNEFWNKKEFLSELLSTMGRDCTGMNISEMINEIVKYTKSQESPLIILDEFDKVNDPVLYFFISLYNQLENECGIVLCSTDYLEKRIMRGLMSNKKGYKEFYSRIGRKFIKMPGVNATDITKICIAYGITDQVQIREVIEDSENDLRRVDRKIHSIKNKHELN